MLVVGEKGCVLFQDVIQEPRLTANLPFLTFGFKVTLVIDTPTAAQMKEKMVWRSKCGNFYGPDLKCTYTVLIIPSWEGSLEM